MATPKKYVGVVSSLEVALETTRRGFSSLKMLPDSELTATGAVKVAVPVGTPLIDEVVASSP